ncbi:MAG: hypothetical protein IT585_06010 [candidate division Zixibacteria bacterium]|nr:hypothetical protein [candidate division Zixibacteria bacterium]
MKRIPRFFLTALVLLTIVSAASAEVPRARATLYFLLNNWQNDYAGGSKFDLNENALGLDALLAPNDRFSFGLNGKLSSAKYDPKGEATLSDDKISSLNDTRLALTYTTAGGMASLTALANLPTGKTKLDDTEFLIASAVADNSRRFATRRFGQGLDLGVEGLAHPQAGNLTFHFGGGFLYKGKYQVRAEDAEKYKYGDEISARAGLDVDAEAIQFMLDGTMLFYLEDKFGDEKVYQSGPTAIIRSQIAYVRDHSVYGGFQFVGRSKAKIRNQANEETLTDEASKSGRNELLIYLGGGYLVNEKLRVNGRLDFQNFSANDYEEGSLLYRPKSNYIGIGGGASYALTETLYGSGMLTYYTGSIDVPADKIDLSGLGLLLALTYRVM